MPLSFQKILNRITGFSVPVFGVSWNPPVLHAKIARELIIFLEDRRVLYDFYELEYPDWAVKSVLEIRAYLTQCLQKVEKDSPLAESVRAMRTACRKFLGQCQGLDLDFSKRYFFWGANALFYSALGEFRGTFGIHIAQISVRYGIDIRDELVQILPTAPHEEKDEQIMLVHFLPNPRIDQHSEVHFTAWAMCGCGFELCGNGTDEWSALRDLKELFKQHIEE